MQVECKLHKFAVAAFLELHNISLTEVDQYHNYFLYYLHTTLVIAGYFSYNFWPLHIILFYLIISPFISLKMTLLSTRNCSFIFILNIALDVFTALEHTATANLNLQPINEKSSLGNNAGNTTTSLPAG